MRKTALIAALAATTLGATVAQAEPIFCDLLISGPEGASPQVTGAFTEIDVTYTDNQFVVDGMRVEEFSVTVAVSLGVEEVFDAQGNTLGFELVSADMATTCRVVEQRE